MGPYKSGLISEGFAHGEAARLLAPRLSKQVGVSREHAGGLVDVGPTRPACSRIWDKPLSTHARTGTGEDQSPR